MSVREEWLDTERRLCREADSLAGILELLRNHVSPALIGGAEWDRLLAVTRALPPSLAAFPFGFEMPLHDPRPGADLGLSLIGGTLSGDFYREAGRAGEAEATAVSRILEQIGPAQQTRLREVVGGELMLEYDIVSARQAERPQPAFFLNTIDQPLMADGGADRISDLHLLLGAVTGALGRETGAARREQAEALYRVLEAVAPEACFASFGVFPARAGNNVRLSLTGFDKTDVAGTFLQRAGLSRQYEIIRPALLRCEARRVFAHFSIHLDLPADGGVGPGLGLGIFTRRHNARDGGYWLDSAERWTALMDCLSEEGLVLAEKQSDFVNWASGAQPLFCKSGMFVLQRGIHHVKIAFTGEQPLQAKGYVYFILCRWPPGD